MPTVYSNVCSKAEEAAVAYLTALATITTATIVPGKSSDGKSAPIVICSAENAVEEPPFTGNYWIDFSATVKSEAAVDADNVPTKAPDDLLIGQVFNAFQQDDLTAQLSSAVADFTCMGVKEYTQESGVSGDCWENSIKFKAYCCGSTLSP